MPSPAPATHPTSPTRAASIRTSLHRCRAAQPSEGCRTPAATPDRARPTQQGDCQLSRRQRRRSHHSNGQSAQDARTRPFGPSDLAPAPDGRNPAVRRRRLEGEGPTSLTLHRHPAHLGELVHRLATAKPAVAAVLYATERDLRLVVDRLVVDVHDPGLDSLG
jgi:hypothetical protein